MNTRLLSPKTSLNLVGLNIPKGSELADIVCDIEWSFSVKTLEDHSCTLLTIKWITVCARVVSSKGRVTGIEPSSGNWIPEVPDQPFVLTAVDEEFNWNLIGKTEPCLKKGIMRMYPTSVSIDPEKCTAEVTFSYLPLNPS